MESLTPYQQTAVQITRASNKIATPQQLADYRLARRPDGSPMYPRYKDMDDMRRISWLGDQFFGLGALTHFQLTAALVAVDATVLDGKIMENSVLREMTLAEMQEAFNNGVFKEYGDYYGISSVTLLGFLKGFARSEKKVMASNLIRIAKDRDEREANARFFRELHNAKLEGRISVTDLSDKRINGKQEKKLYTDAELSAHREKIRQQAAEIRRQAGKEANNEK